MAESLLDPRTALRIERQLLSVHRELGALQHDDPVMPVFWRPTYELVQYALTKEPLVEAGGNSMPGTVDLVFWMNDQIQITLFWVKSAWIPPKESPPFRECGRCGSVACLWGDAARCLSVHTIDNDQAFLHEEDPINIPF